MLSRSLVSRFHYIWRCFICAFTFSWKQSLRSDVLTGLNGRRVQELVAHLLWEWARQDWFSAAIMVWQRFCRNASRTCCLQDRMSGHLSAVHIPHWLNVSLCFRSPMFTGLASAELVKLFGLEKATIQKHNTYTHKHIGMHAHMLWLVQPSCRGSSGKQRNYPL